MLKYLPLIVGLLCLSIALNVEGATMTRQASVITVNETVGSPVGTSVPTLDLKVVQSPMANIAGIRRSPASGGLDLKMSEPPWDPWSSTGKFANNKDAIDAVGTFLQYYANRAARRVCKVLRDKKLSNAHLAIVKYTQDLTIDGDDARIIASMLVHDRPSPDAPKSAWEGSITSDSCKHEFLGVNIRNKFTKIIVATYNQGAIAQGLPGDNDDHHWNLPKAGIFSWVMYKVPTDNPSGNRTTVKINGEALHDENYMCGTNISHTKCPTSSDGPLGEWGYFDEPQVIEDTDDKKYLYHCKVGSSGTCDKFSPTTLIKPADTPYDPLLARDELIKERLLPLMKQYNAQFGILRYGREVEPIYKQNQNDPNDYVPQRSIRVYRRKLTMGDRYFFITPSKAARFTNEGVYGYVLAVYHVISLTTLSNEQTQFLRVTKDRTTSPDTHYKKTVKLHDNSYNKNPTLLEDMIIDPFQTSQVYHWKDDTVNGLKREAYDCVAILNQYPDATCPKLN